MNFPHIQFACRTKIFQKFGIKFPEFQKILKEWYQYQEEVTVTEERRSDSDRRKNKWQGQKKEQVTVTEERTSDNIENVTTITKSI